jgi:peptide/nickel transport system substrate-binding protein
MTHRRSRVAFAATSVVLTVAVAACSSSKGGGSTPTTPSSSAAASGGYNAALTSVVNPSTKTGGTLNLVSTSDVDSFDGTRSYYANSWDMERLFDRGLMAYDAKPGAAGAKVVPDLASAPGKVSADGLTVTYTLRDGIKFQDGTPITSKDVKYGIERSFSSDVLTGGPTYAKDFLTGYQGQTYGGVYKDTDPNKLGLKAVETPDDKTVVFHLNKAFADWDYIMALPLSTPVPVKADQDPTTGGVHYQNHVVATGPYMFQSYDPGKQVVWVKNPNWDKSTDPIRSQLVDKIVLTQGLQSDEIDKRLESGAADINVEGTGVQTTFQTKILSQPALKKNADDPVTGFTRYFALNTQVPELKNIDCRKAVEFAADKVALQTAQGGKVGGQIATTFSPPTLVGYVAANPYPSGPDNTGDLAQAKAELAKCGSPNGFKTNIASSNKGKGPKVAAALQTALARVGIQAQVQTFDPSTYYSTVIGTPSNVHSKDLGIMIAGWGADWPAGYGFYSSIVDGRKILQQGGNSNYAEENNPQVNALLDKLASDPSEANREQYTAQIDQLVMADAVVLPYIDDSALVYRNPRVTNVYITNAFGIYDFVSMGVSDGK